jgi:hypothetical protein
MTIGGNIDAMLAEAVTLQMDEQSAAEQGMRETQKRFNADIEQARAEVLKKFSSGRSRMPQYSDQVKEIADMLSAQPFMVKPVQIFMQRLADRINAAITESVEAMLDTNEGTNK